MQLKNKIKFAVFRRNLEEALDVKTFFKMSLRLMTTRIFLYYFLRDQNSQHFDEDLLAVNASAFSFVLCFKAIDYTGTSNYVISAN